MKLEPEEKTIASTTDPERWRRVMPLLEAALDLEPGERPALLAERCGGDAELRREVESYLRAEERMGGFISRPVVSLRPDPGVAAGSQIGPYRVVREIGRGGMGAVYLAQRTDEVFDLQVALKVLKRGMASDEVVRRFRKERQILADLEHPDIARILDGGTTADGLPYLVMEYVEGLPIDRYCDAERLTAEQCLELFRRVCSAVHVAHQSLVVHRDLKPTNILVTPEGSPKLLDFGIAKILAPGDGAGLAWPEYEFKLMTPAFASPEQVRGRPINTASDVYSLGVLLYRLLTGRQPYDLEGCEPWEVSRVISEVEPMRPSVVAAHRRGSSRPGPSEPDSAPAGGRPPRIPRRLAGDLDAIVLKAMSKEPQQRYGSVLELSEDVRRCLEDLPTLACRRTWSYVAGKFVRRHLLQLAAAALLLLMVTSAALSVVTWRQAAREKALRNDFVEFLDSLFLYTASDVAGGDEIDSLRVLDRVEEKLRELEVEPPSQAEILESLSRVYEERGLDAEALPPLERALAIRRRLAPEGSPELVRMVDDLADLHSRLGNPERAESLRRQAQTIRRRPN